MGIWHLPFEIWKSKMVKLASKTSIQKTHKFASLVNRDIDDGIVPINSLLESDLFWEQGEPETGASFRRGSFEIVAQKFERCQFAKINWDCSDKLIFVQVAVNCGLIQLEA